MNNVVDLRPLQNDIREVSDNLARISEHVGNVDFKIDNVTNDLKTARSDLVELRRVLEKHIQDTNRMSNIQISETKVGNLKAELDRQFGHYSGVRRTSIGVLQSFDIGNVTNVSVTQISEELMIQTPKYWLAPALVTLAAWSRNDHDIAEKSTIEAFKRNASKTSLFFALVLQRQGRTEASAQWLKSYLNSLTNTALTREFAVILEACSLGVFGPDAQKLVAGTLASWDKSLRLNNAVNEAQASQWMKKLYNNRHGLVVDDVQTLKKLSPDFPRLRNLVESASALGETTREFSKVKEANGSTGNILDRLDDLLELLISEYDNEELPLRREVAFHDAVINSNGDIQTARNTADEYNRSLQETMDAVTMQTRTALEPESLGVSTLTQRNAVGTCISDFQNGLSRFCAAYRSEYVDNARIVLDSSHSGYAAQFNFPTLECRTSDPEDAVVHQIGKRWNGVFEPLIADAKFKPIQMAKPAVIGIVLVFLGFFISPTLGILALIGASGWNFWQFSSLKKDATAKMQQLEQAKTDAINVSTITLREARAEYIDLMYEYEDFDDQEQNLRKLLSTWPTISANSTEASEQSTIH